MLPRKHEKRNSRLKKGKVISTLSDQPGVANLELLLPNLDALRRLVSFARKPALRINAQKIGMILVQGSSDSPTE